MGQIIMDHRGLYTVRCFIALNRDVSDWLFDEIDGKWDHFNNTYFFENEEDAFAFKIRWL